MSVDQLRDAAHKLERKSRSEALFSMVGCTLVFAWSARLVLHPQLMLTPDQWTAASLWSVRLGCALICVGAVYEVYRAVKKIWSPPLAPQASLETTVRSYRIRLENRRDRFRNFWNYKALWLFLLGAVLAAAPRLIVPYFPGRQYLLEVAPLGVLLVLWLIAVAVLRKRVQRKLRQEIEQLRAFEREYQA